MPQVFFQLRCHIEADEDFLQPETEFRPTEVSGKRLFCFPTIAIALRQIKCVACNTEWIGLRLHSFFKELRVALIGQRIPTSCAVMLIRNRSDKLSSWLARSVLPRRATQTANSRQATEGGQAF